MFVAGATGATGTVFARMASMHDLVLHVRPATAPQHAFGADPRARIFDLTDPVATADALRGCDAVLSLIGTMRKRFDTGDTYASSDIATTQALVDGARAAGVPRFLLLSSLGAGGPGAYARAKGESERIVRGSGLRWTIFRPSALVSPAGGPEGHHGRRTVPPGVLGIGAVLARVFLLRSSVNRFRPIPIDVLCRAFLAVLDHPADGAILDGQGIWSRT